MHKVVVAVVMELESRFVYTFLRIGDRPISGDGIGHRRSDGDGARPRRLGLPP